jgi:predicted nucleic acid-binding protein
MNKIIISDTSCLIALSNIGMLDILKNLFQEVIITKEVYDEFGNNLPDWIKITDVKNIAKQKEIETRLDKGEASSIALALEISDSMLIIDEIKGRKIARSLNIEIIGTIGVLIMANKRGILKDFMGIILKMVNKGFRLSDDIINKLIDKYRNK